MTRGRRATVPALSLFPFLAVLLSTMGILVLWLYLSVQLASRQVRDRQHDQQEQTARQLRELQADRELDEIRIAGWTGQRSEVLEKSVQLRMQQAALLEQIEEIRSEIVQLQADRDRQLADRTANREQQMAEQAALDQRVQQLETQLAERRSELERQPVSLEPVMYSIVPHSGEGGTQRRPAYVECTARGVILQPFGIELTAADFIEPDMPGNPLDAALGEIRDYWVRNDVAGSEGRPYPLLVVRPDGAAAYAASRRAMRSWSDEFGYELVPAELPLEYGPADPELQRVLEETVQRSRALLARYHREMEQQRQLAKARQQEANTVVSGLRANRNGGGFVSVDGSANPRSPRGAAGNGRSSSNLVQTRSTSPGAEDANSSTGASDPSSRLSTGASETLAGSSAMGASSEAAGATGSQFGMSGIGEPPPATAQSETAQEGEESGAGPAGGDNPDGIAGLKLPDPAPDCPCLADQRGADWAIRRGENQRTGYVRPVTIVCGPDRVDVDRGASVWLDLEPIQFGSNPVATADQLVQTVQRVVNSWGSPPEYGYWRPELRIRVLGGGKQRMAELQQLLQGSGIELSEVR